MKKFILEKQELILTWVSHHYLKLAIFNALVMFMILLRSAGYFDPYLPISVNMVILATLILSVILLDARSESLYVVSLVFWLFALFLKVVGINVWAERTSIYVYQAICLATILLLIEVSGMMKKGNGKN